MNDPTEQTAGDAVLKGLLGTTNATNPIDDRIVRLGYICDELGIDPDQPLDRLRADLAIAARARACTTLSGPHAGDVACDNKLVWSAAGLLAYLLNGEQP